MGMVMPCLGNQGKMRVHQNTCLGASSVFFGGGKKKGRGVVNLYPIALLQPIDLVDEPPGKLWAC